MKTKLKKIYLLLIIFLSLDKVYAATTLDLNTQTIISILCISLVVFGLALIVVGKMSEKKGNTYSEKDKKDKTEIVGLKDKNKVENNFSSDIIFKEIPTFSNKKFFDITSEEFKKKLKKEDNELIEINIEDKNIIDFEIKEKKYIITSEFKIEVKKEIEKDTYTYLIKSEKSKEETNTNINLTNCPNCGGKIKDHTINRCIHCGYQLEKENQSKTWKIIKIEKMD